MPGQFLLAAPGSSSSTAKTAAFPHAPLRAYQRIPGLAMAFTLIESAQDRWRCVNAPHLVALVRAGATFIDGKLAERASEEAA